MSNTVQGTIKLIGEVQHFGANNFAKSELVVVTDEKYAQSIMIEFLQDKSELPFQYKEGDEVIVSFNISGREWVSPQGETKYFNSLQGWKIEKAPLS